jgi:TP901 family phage tail tape measure protein
MAFGSLAELYVEVLPDTSKFGRQLTRELERKNRRPIVIPVKPDVRRFKAETTRAASLAGRSAGRAYNDAFARGSGGLSRSLRTGTRGIAGIATGVISSAAKVAAVGIAAVTTATAVGFVKATNKAGQFDKTMRMAGTTLHASGQQMKSLTDLAIDMGAKTSFSAPGAADAMLALAKGGLRPAQIQAGALHETLTLATAGGLELGDAADYMVRGLGAFHLKARQASRISSALAGAANASTGSVESMGLALAQVSATAASSGQSIEATTAALAAFDNAGIRGSDAGTSLKTMLARLVPMTDKASAKFKALGLITKDGANQFFKANGEMKPMAEIAGVLEKALGGLSTKQRIAAMNTLFGSDATRAATILMNEGEAGIRKYQKATSDKAAAEKLAKTATEGYAGALERIKGSIETVQIIGGKEFLPGVTRTLNGISNWVDRNQDAIKTVFSVASGALEDFGETAHGVLSGFFRDMAGGRSFKSFSDTLATHQVEITNFGINVIDTFIAVTQATTGWISGTIRDLGQADIAFANTLSTVGLIAAAFAVLPTTSKGAREALVNVANAAQQQASSIRQSGNAQISLANTLDGKLSPALQAARNRVVAFRDTAIAKAETREATYSLSKAIDKVGKSGDVAKHHLQKYNLESDTGTKAQRAFGRRVLDVRQRMIDQAEAGIRAGDSQKTLTKRWNDGKQALYREFRQMGFSKTRAQELADKYGKIPGKVKTDISQPGMDKARRDTRSLDERINALNDKKVRIMVALGKQGFSRKGLQETVDRSMRAKGGKLDGPGTGTSDSILGVDEHGMPLARVSKGEWVINAKSSEKYDDVLQAINQNKLAGGGTVGRTIVTKTSNPTQAMRAIPGQADALANSMAVKTWAAWQKVIEGMGAGTGHGSRRRVHWKGGTFTERYRNTLRAADKRANINVIQGGFRPRTSYSGSSHAGDALDTSWRPASLSALHRAGSYAWHRTPAQGPWGHHIHAIPKKGFGYPAGSGKWQQADAARGGNGLMRGGSYQSAGWAKVGERGPELIQGNKGDKVTPLNQPIRIELHQDGLIAMIQGEIDDNNEFKASMARLSRG